MLRILEVPTLRRRVAPLSVETCHRLAGQGLVDQRTELLRGVIVEKTSKSPLHVAIVRNLFEAASAAALGSVVARIRPAFPVTLSSLRKLTTSTVVKSERLWETFPDLPSPSFIDALRAVAEYYRNV